MELKDLGSLVSIGVVKIRQEAKVQNMPRAEEAQAIFDKAISVITNEVISKVNAFYDDKKKAVDAYVQATVGAVIAKQNEALTAATGRLNTAIDTAVDSAKADITAYLTNGSSALAANITEVNEAIQTLKAVSAEGLKNISELKDKRDLMLVEFSQVRDAFMTELQEFADRHMKRGIDEINSVAEKAISLYQEASNQLNMVKASFSADEQSALAKFVTGLVEPKLFGMLWRAFKARVKSKSGYRI